MILHSFLDDEIECVLKNDILIQRIKQLASKNLFAWDIARETGITRSVIIAVCRRKGITLRSAIESLA